MFHSFIFVFPYTHTRSHTLCFFVVVSIICGENIYFFDLVLIKYISNSKSGPYHIFFIMYGLTDFEY